MSPFRSSLIPIVTTIVAVVVWELVTIVGNIPKYLLPAPTDIAVAIAQNRASLAGPTALTLVEILLGFALSLGVGIFLAMVIVSWDPVRRAVYPLLVASQTVPKIAIAPLFVVWFGFGMLSKVLIAFLIAFFPILISTVVGFESVEPERLRLLRSMGATRWQQFTKVRIPAALPSMFGGIKVAITLSVIGAIVGEFVGSTSGLGNMMLVATGELNTTMVFAGLVILTILGLVLFYLAQGLEWLLTSWQHAGDAEPQLSVATTTP